MSESVQKGMSLFPGIEKDAFFSPDRVYRYWLTRTWAKELGIVNFIGLNPSTADETIDDRTIKKCMKYAAAWGYGGMIMTNVFAYRSTYPRVMKKYREPIGPRNDEILLITAHTSQLVVCAWSADAVHLGRADSVLRLLEGVELHYLKKNEGKQPQHPLYLLDSLRPVLWKEGVGSGWHGSGMFEAARHDPGYKDFEKLYLGKFDGVDPEKGDEDYDRCKKRG